MTSFLQIDENSDFTLDNIPFGVASKNGEIFACTRIGNAIINLDLCQKLKVFSGIDLPVDIFQKRYLNDFIALGKSITGQVRKVLQKAFSMEGDLKSNILEVSFITSKYESVQMLLPIQIGDYTDFFSSREHATNTGLMFRDPANALLPNWLHLPVGYHGRSSSIVVSGTEIKRPQGQTMPPDAEKPVFGPSKQMDFELELGFVIGQDSNLGETIGTSDAENYIFGMMLFNDWSARDIQRWEYVPLGPFLGKNFASTLSPWIVTMEALEPFRVEGPVQEPEVLPYLKYDGHKNYDIHLTVDIKSESGSQKTISTSNFKYMYWNLCQQLAHHTVNGCNVKVGDLMASGTISGPTPDSYGSMLEICWKGTKPLQLPDGSERRFIHDGDSILMRGWCERDGIRIGFGECDGKIVAK